MTRESGSLFLEALVATVILATMTLALLLGYKDNARALEQLDTRGQALLVAQSRLDDAVTRLTPGTRASRGRDGAFGWRVEITPLAAPASNAGRLQQVTVHVRHAAGGADLAVLRTLRLVREPAS